MMGLFQPALKEKYTEGSVFRTKCPVLSRKENAGQVLGLWASVYAHACVSLHVTAL